MAGFWDAVKNGTWEGFRVVEVRDSSDGLMRVLKIEVKDKVIAVSAMRGGPRPVIPKTGWRDK